MYNKCITSKRHYNVYLLIMKRKAFTIVELLVVIAILAILSTISIFGYTRFIKNANESADMTLLTQINRSLTAAETIGETNTVNDVYNLLYNNGLNDSNLIAKQEGYEFVYNKETNRFEYLETGWENYGTISADNWRSLFGYTTTEEYEGVIGYKQFTGSTTFTYKYVSTEKNVSGKYDVLIGDTITEDNTLTYWLHIPENYDPRISYPLVTYIHGSGGNLYYQNWNDHGVRTFTLNEFDNPSYAIKMICSGTGINRLSTNFYNDNSIGVDGAFGGDWDDGFVSMWFKWIKDHPEDDAFFIFVQMNDELWFENPAVYTIDGKTYNQLSISNAYKAGEEYGEKFSTGSGNYNFSYVAKNLGVNVWFQLLTQLQDNIMNQYNVDSTRLFISGSSLGGQSTFDLLAHYPNRYAGAFPCVPVCTDISDEVINANLDTKIIALVGSTTSTGSDGTVSANPTNEFIDKFKAAGGQGEMIIAGGGHRTGAFKNTDNFTKIMNIIKSE